MSNIELLDCTLRDGAYINGSHFGAASIKGIIKSLQRANADIIECGWLKDSEHEYGTTYYHVPSDIEQYLVDKKPNITYVVMIDWDRYDTDRLPDYDGKSIDAIRVVFPHGRHKEGIEVGRKIREKGYKVFFQAANTLAYSDDDLVELAKDMNEFKPVSVSVVDTFGAMYDEDLLHILDVLKKELSPDIKIGFHSHNNQQLAFSLAMKFVEDLKKAGRDCIVDATLCGMGRGAGNATTELVVSYLNKKQSCNYDLDAVMNAIDIYMQEYQEKYSWGYSTPYFIAGLYQCHVNNIAYLLNNHRTNAKDMRNIIDSLSQEDRRKYDYDLLEQKYLENQNRIVDDEKVFDALSKELSGKEVLLLCPGGTLIEEKDKIESYIEEHSPITIGINAIIPGYKYDYLFFVNHARYEYAEQAHPNTFKSTRHILLSNIKTGSDSNEIIINYNRAIKRGWEHFDNAAICGLRLMDRLGISNISIAGFDGFKKKNNESYADESLPSLNPEGKWDELNVEIREIYQDFIHKAKNIKKVNFVTESIFTEED